MGCSNSKGDSLKVLEIDESNTSEEEKRERIKLKENENKNKGRFSKKNSNQMVPYKKKQ